MVFVTMAPDPAAPSRPPNAARIKAALWFAERGFGVFSVWSANDDGSCRCPLGATCTSSGKHPITPNGFSDATLDPDRIRTLLNAGSNPNYGLVNPEGVFALDVDGTDGLARFAALETSHGALPPTLRTLTAHGQHVFLRWPGDLPRPLKQMFGYVTRWGSGKQAGYVIGPRSVHASGFVYVPAGPFVDVAEMPLGWATAALGGETGPIMGIRGPAPLPGIGGRHDWLRDRARYLRGVLDDRGVLRAAMMAENARLDEPKSEAEVDRAIGEVFERFPADPVEVAEERVARRLGEDTLGILGLSNSAAFPPAPSPVAFEGLIGECVHDLATGTDASLVGLLGSMLAFCGALIPGAARFHRLQTSSPFIALVGESSIGRKGTAMMRVSDAMSEALEPVYVSRAVLDGLNSGEGLVSALAWKRASFPYEPTVGLVFEEEYASLLASRGREGSTLDPKMRAAFDGGPISNRRSGETKTVVPPYWLPALIAITPDELRLRLESGALQSGSANRWLYLPVVKRDTLPSNSEPEFAEERRELLLAARRLAVASPGGRIVTVDHAVTARLAEYADWLPTVAHGIARDLTRRLAVIAFRVALIHTLAERAAIVAPEHLDRAIALTEYARSGVAWVFGETVGSRDADLLYRHLLDLGHLTKHGITQGIIRDPLRQQAAVDELVRIGLAKVETTYPAGAGRPRTDLVPTSARGNFVHFVRDSVTAPTGNHQKPHEMHEIPLLSTNRSARNSHEIRTEFEKSARNLHGIRSGEWLRPCSADLYPVHQSAHRQTKEGWVCDLCWPTE